MTKATIILTTLGALSLFIPTAFAASAPAGYKFCKVKTQCDTPAADGQVVCPYIDSDDDALKASLLLARCKQFYGTDTEYGNVAGGHPACVINSLLPEAVNCP
ncbi:hypothetical protein IB262_05265 [Ensifer sp. ENS02]|uniref:hypothetical protein n=1 Tax=Ensifer sp. ENS02 TaxID=2769290 RepID=UPI001782FCFB|nr:hypothetical protein [Ensifer sp. ENS02]MBD9519303.1 hypothetical protein [Ensifer sp. ENS02]